MTPSTTPTCPNCGTENASDDIICMKCGAVLDTSSKTRIHTRPSAVKDVIEQKPRWGTSRFEKIMALEVKLHETDVVFAFDYEDIDEIVIGRHDTDTGIIPHIDLEPHGGAGGGVSRQHAVITQDDGALYLVDQKSINGTYLNAQRIQPDQPRILRDSDVIRVGDLVMRIAFRRNADSS